MSHNFSVSRMVLLFYKIDGAKTITFSAEHRVLLDLKNNNSYYQLTEDSNTPKYFIFELRMQWL